MKLSVIIPCYNVAKTISTALDSVLMQVVDFEYEIIAVDDASTDDTQDILKHYAAQYPQIKIITHKKNGGNNIAFYDAIKAARGDYFCVLDGDDIYTVNNKLQRQVDFLDDKSNQKYVGVAHLFLMKYHDNTVKIAPVSNVHEFNFLNFLTGAVYCHTSTYMFRNVFRGHNVDFFKEEILRGDSPRIFFALLFSRKKIKILNFVGSVYNISENGIYTKLSSEQKLQRELKLLYRFRDFLITPTEKKALDLRIADVKNHVDLCAAQNKENAPQKSTGMLKSELLARLQSDAFNYAYSEKDYMFHGYYKSEYIDSVCASLGYCELVRNGFSPLAGRKLNKNHLMIVIPALNPRGGGIFSEILEIFTMYRNKSIRVLLTDSVAVSDEVASILSKYDNVDVVCAGVLKESSITDAMKIISDFAPEKIYFYVGHTDVLAQSLVQPGLSKNINIISYDHGFVLGLTNSNFDYFIVKRPVDYWIFKAMHGDKVIYIPCWEMLKTSGKYIAFNNHNKLITASGVARWYKLQGGMFSYVDMILNSLLHTGGRHIHYGEIPDNIKKYIYDFLHNHKLSANRFVNIPWTENLQQSLLDEHVDVFIEPFPIVSYKMTLNALAAGVPVFAYAGNTRLSVLDFIYPDNLVWSNPDDFLAKLKTFTAITLNKHSKKSLDYFDNNHNTNKLKSYFIKEKELLEPRFVDVSDNIIMDVADCDLLWKYAGGKTDLHPTNTAPKVENVPVKPVSVKHGKMYAMKCRYKNMFYIVLLLIGQIPVVDHLVCNSKRRAGLMEKLHKWRR